MTTPQFPPLQSKPSTKRCTNCSAPMTLYVLPGRYVKPVEIDVCMACNAIWFDQYESSQLSPDGTVALFQLINERGSTATSAAAKFGEGLRCVTCGDSMRQTQDRVRNTRFTYQACRHGHGRLTTFYNFLSEKQFVRELTQQERAKLAATVHQVRCSGCGAAVDLSKVDACEYCRAPVAVFDRDAAKKAINHYLQERQKQNTVVITEPRERPRYRGNLWSTYERADLGADILYALSRAASRWVSGGGRAAATGVAAGAAPAIAGGNLEPFPDATSALFGNEAASGAVAGAGEALSNALPNATDALFGAASSASSNIGDAVTDAASHLGDGALESLGDAASSAGEGVVDLVTDGIGSLLGSLFD